MFNYLFMLHRSMMEMANADVKSKEVDQVVDNMMTEHGFGNKDVLSLTDFQSVMTQYSTELNDAALLMPGIVFWKFSIAS